MNIEKLTWYATRAGGIVAWCLLAAGLILGLALSSRVFGRRVSPAWTLAVHRYLGGLGVVFTGLHVTAIMLDDFVDFGFVEVLVPWASTWRPGAVAWGIVAMYLMVAIELTSFAMKRLPKRLWRAVHWTSAPLFVTATVHGYQAGSDVGRAFVIVTLGVIVLLAALTTVRVVRARGSDERADPRDLLDLPRRNPPQMRPEPPKHVLDALTLASAPPDRVLRPAPAVRELVSVGGLDPTAPPPCPPATSLADALPEVPGTSLADAQPESAEEHDPFVEALSAVAAPTAPAADDGAAERRPGPVPGVWKRSASSS